MPTKPFGQYGDLVGAYGKPNGRPIGTTNAARGVSRIGTTPTGTAFPNVGTLPVMPPGMPPGQPGDPRIGTTPIGTAFPDVGTLPITTPPTAGVPRVGTTPPTGDSGFTDFAGLAGGNITPTTSPLSTRTRIGDAGGLTGTIGEGVGTFTDVDITGRGGFGGGFDRGGRIIGGRGRGGGRGGGRGRRIGGGGVIDETVTAEEVTEDTTSGGTEDVVPSTGGTGNDTGVNYWLQQLKDPITAQIGLTDQERKSLSNQARARIQGSTKAMMDEFSRISGGRGFRAGESGITDTALSGIAQQGQQQLGSFQTNLATAEAQNRFGQNMELNAANLSRLLGGGGLSTQQMGIQAGAGAAGAAQNLSERRFSYGQEQDALNMLLGLYGGQTGQQNQQYQPWWAAYTGAGLS